LVLTESAAIIHYLSETFPHSAEVYVPDDTASRAKLNEWCYFVMSELDAGSLYVVRRHDGLKQIYGEAPTAVESAKSYFLHNLEAMAARIGGDNAYLFGDQISVADILLMTCLDWASSCGISLPESVSSYWRRVALRPAYQAALKKNFAK
jgi:glutathione S-transferase